MISVDANILLYSLNKDSPWQRKSLEFMRSLSLRRDVAISELVLVELYTLLRNPMVLKNPLKAPQAVEIIQTYRAHPYWSLIGFEVDSRLLHQKIWEKAASENFARRRIYDVRLGISLQQQGVKEFATVNTKDFQDLNLFTVLNPIEDGS